MRIIKTSLFVSILLLFIPVVLNGQNTPLFKTGDRVCFVGNSITHLGEFHHNILLYYRTRFPESPVMFYNCGISGDVTGGVLNRLESDILVHKPTHAVIMIGMNDVMRQLYGSALTLNADTLIKRENALTVYRTNLDSIVRILISKNVKVILQKPSIYDQTAKLVMPNNLGVNEALKTCADYIQILADKYKLQTIDYWTILSEINKTLQQKDPKATIVGADRVHPTSPGSLVMTYQFLKTTSGVNPQIVSLITIGKGLKNSNKQSANCQISQLKRKSKSVSFVVKENSLPFPTVQSQKSALEWVPFIKELNTEMLLIKGLAPGSYLLKIDTLNLGLFTNTELQKGVNLAINDKTPQYQQAMNVRMVLTKLWEIESKLRAIKHIEYMHLKNFEPKTDVVAVRRYIEPLFKEKYNGTTYTYLISQLERYILNKPIEKQLEQQSDSLRTEVYKVAQTKEHLFQIIPLK